MFSEATKNLLIIVNFKSLTRKPSYGSFFSAWNTDFKNVIFEKKNWAPSEVIEVKRSFSRPNFVFHLVFTSFYLELSAFCVWPQQPRRPQKGLREFFQNLHFWNQCVPRKKVRCVAGSWSQFSLNLSTEEVCLNFARFCSQSSGLTPIAIKPCLLCNKNTPIIAVILIIKWMFLLLGHATLSGCQDPFPWPKCTLGSVFVCQRFQKSHLH